MWLVERLMWDEKNVVLKENVMLSLPKHLAC
ncbi:hypothetical protein N008_14545 [Hymenobacter sp. APR13]|nr:hypothetical protein N008_14545 [Hymenobacter sp. APR13]